MRGSLRLLGVFVCAAAVLSGATPSGVAQAKPVAAAATTLVAAAPVQQRPVAGASIAMGAGAPYAPAFGRDFPDPSVISAGGRYYAFATQTAWEARGRVFPILVSTDLKGWTYVADVFAKAPTWGTGDWWAPAVVARNGTYYLYYSGYAPARTHCVAVATASAPAGPYTDHGPIACRDGESAIGYIDPWPLVAGGKAYLYFSVDGPSHHSISMVPLSDDMLRVAGPRKELLTVTQDWERLGFPTVEGPTVFAWGSSFVMLYSGGAWRGRYGMGYAIAPSPAGPFAKTTVPLLRSGASLAGPGGGSFFADATGAPWMAFHAWVGNARELYTRPLSIS